MRTDTGQVFRLEDYRPSAYLIPRTDLTFRLSPEATAVVAAAHDRAPRRAPHRRAAGARRRRADAEAHRDRRHATLDASGLCGDAATADHPKPPPARRFPLTIETELAPARNKALMGLYRSSGVYCTQCEAEGFRRITYFLDRPDVLSVYTVRIEARARRGAAAARPTAIRSSSGDARRTAGTSPSGTTPSPSRPICSRWSPAISARSTTASSPLSGRKVELGIYVEHGKEARAAYAMDALKRSMRWDEEAFGREYDLDVFNIVAVSDFNMGAMENKGLNIFNDKYVLADPETATDADYANIEAIIAHEYFHNWTGNRITCRDWFQLCLKEGLTVFRDQEFSADQRSRAVKRIAEVRTLRAHQFPEDAGPLAHPVRPRRYREINNFYTATVYEKGAEVVRMIRTLLGAETFRAGMDLYFERHDGEAATIEDFLKVFEDASGRDLSQFALWYHQAGTPNLTVTLDATIRRRSEFTLEIEQSVPPTPSESRKRLMHIPLAFGLVGAGRQRHRLRRRRGRRRRGRRHPCPQAPPQWCASPALPSGRSLSLNRGFSAPITLSIEQNAGRPLLPGRATTAMPFSRWQAFNTLLTDALIAGFAPVRGGKAAGIRRADSTELAGAIAGDETLEPAFRALALALPGEADIAREIGKNIDPDAIFAGARGAGRWRSPTANAGAVRAALRRTRAATGPFSPDAASAGRRALAQRRCSTISRCCRAAPRLRRPSISPRRPT